MKKKKFCPHCKKTKLIDDFYRNFGRHDGHESACKICRKKALDKRTEASRAKFRRKILPSRSKAYSKILHATRSGKIKKENCFLCGSNEHIEGHHLNYRYPLKVIWLCRKHHKEVDLYKLLKI